ncbi:hypothetical protein [Paenibacillus sp. MER 99-2]|uniref:hypothetical protein n=1 Tax=Paenibacillus sp. MER 99-2 TaxID=2939572 RepID=UPI00203F0083|nr:hypothetical protein [Paenibacillus sp. MER 99-2]MCM3175349.1 hypothetical protein [Paenibacillus sp. MER 99-2]
MGDDQPGVNTSLCPRSCRVRAFLFAMLKGYRKRDAFRGLAYYGGNNRDPYVDCLVQTFYQRGCHVCHTVGEVIASGRSLG